MTIPAYIRPQLTIKQLLDVTPDATVDKIHATIIGAQYFLNRYSADVAIPGATYAAELADQDLAYQWFNNGIVTALPTNYVPETSSVEVYIENGEVDLGTIIHEDSDANITDDDAIIMLSANGRVISFSELIAVLNGNDDTDHPELVRGLEVGDRVYVTLDAGGAQPVRTITAISEDKTEITLNAPIVAAGGDFITQVSFTALYSGLVDSTATATEVTIIAGATVQISNDVPNALLLDGYGTVFASYRALVPATATDRLVNIDTSADITENFGPIDLENDLAYGCARALSGSQGKRVLALAVAEDSVDAYNAALRKIEATDLTYALVALTTSTSIHQAVAAHVADMSTDVKKNFRRQYIGVDSPGEYTLAADIPFTASDYNGGTNNYITVDTADLNFASISLSAGDLLVVSGTEYEISEVASESEVILAVTGPASGTGTFTAADTVDNQKTFVQNIARSFSDRRNVVVWVEDGQAIVDGAFTTVPNKYLAAEVAGLRSAAAPQSGLTRTEITTVTDAPAMYFRYTPDDLDDVAAEGVFIIAQDVESGTVYIRHQLTTETNLGSLYYEDSVGTNIDDLSFQIKDALQGFIGVRNVTPQTIFEIENRVQDILLEATLTGNNLINITGPQIISFQDLVVEADDLLKDRINVSVQVEVPLPLNNIDVFLRASVGLTI